MKNYKIFVPTEEDIRKVQEKAYSLGYSWPPISTGVALYTKAPFLYVYDDGSMGYGNNISDFIDNTNSLISVNDFLALPEPEPEAPSHEEIISKWWKDPSRVDWFRIGIYETGSQTPYCANNPTNAKYSAYWFRSAKSADIPPEGEG